MAPKTLLFGVEKTRLKSIARKNIDKIGENDKIGQIDKIVQKCQNRTIYFNFSLSQ